MSELLNTETLQDFLEDKYRKFNSPEFVANDPILVPHQFSSKEDVEISGLISATIAWGQRKSIIKNALSFMDLMDNAPYDFVMNHTLGDLIRFEKAVHRTFNGQDLSFFIISIRNIYSNHNGLESVFYSDQGVYNGLAKFYKIFFSISHDNRTRRQVANVETGSAAKRLNMYLRWMVRKDKCGVDFGIWNKYSPVDLHIPLDVHSGRVARMLGLLNRTQNDWKAVCELTEALRKFDPVDPVKYDFALFGVGVNEDF